MTDTDTRIRAALSAEDQAFLDGLDHERGLFAQVGDMFHGPMGRWTMLVYGMAIALSALGAWTIVRMFEATTTRELILWTAAAAAAWSAVSAIKLWAWMRMSTLTILRELKRIELRVAQIDGR
jgi:hypothetical protein